MTTAVISSLLAALALALFEGMGRFYPARETWERLRRRHGRRAVRAWRRRFESAADRTLARRLAGVLLALVVGWIALADLLDKFWYEVALDATPYVIVAAALLRSPAVLFKITDRMREYEKDAGFGDDEDGDDEYQGPTDLAL